MRFHSNVNEAMFATMLCFTSFFLFHSTKTVKANRQKHLHKANYLHYHLIFPNTR